MNIPTADELRKKREDAREKVVQEYIIIICEQLKKYGNAIVDGRKNFITPFMVMPGLTEDEQNYIVEIFKEKGYKVEYLYEVSKGGYWRITL